MQRDSTLRLKQSSKKKSNDCLLKACPCVCLETYIFREREKGRGIERGERKRERKTERVRKRGK